MTAEIHGPRRVPPKRERRGMQDEFLVVVKTANRITHYRYPRQEDAETFASEARAAVNTKEDSR